MKRANEFEAEKGPVAAAELLLGNGLRDEAFARFLAANELIRAAEIRHDQNRFEEAAELYERSGRSEGAGAIVFASEDRTKEICRNAGTEPVWITGIGASNEHHVAGPDYRRHKYMGRIWSDHIASHKAYEMAGIADPLNEIGVIELHDAFIKQLQITMGELDFVPIGRTDELIEEEIMTPGGKVLVNPSGGLTTKGHPVGATGVGQIHEIVTQLRGQAGERQVHNPKVGLTHNGGGILGIDAAAMALHLFKR